MFDRSLRDTSSGLTDVCLSSEIRGSDIAEAENSGYSDLHWDPRTGFWGYHTNKHAWTDAETSDGSISDSSVRSYAKFDSDYTAESYLDLFLFKNLHFSVVTRRSFRSHQNTTIIQVYSEVSSAEIFDILSKLASQQV